MLYAKTEAEGEPVFDIFVWNYHAPESVICGVGRIDAFS